MFFGFLWILAFISGVTTFTLSHVVLQWFWREEIGDDDAGKRFWKIPHAYYTTVRYHLGTVALGELYSCCRIVATLTDVCFRFAGAMILSIINFVRYFTAYLQRRMAAQGKESKTLRIIFCAAQCILKCLQKCVEFVNQNAFIFCAL